MGRGAAQRVFDAIDPAKDVDGFHPVNVGRLVQGRAHLAPCTPSGVMAMLDRFGIAIAGARAVVLGRSDIVGKTDGAAAAAPRRDGHGLPFEDDRIAAVAAEADIVVAAIGRAGFVTREFIKPGATVIDVGINRVTDARRSGRASRRGLATGRRTSTGVDRWSSATCTRGGGSGGALTPVPAGSVR